MDDVRFSSLLGKTLTKVDVGDDEIVFTTTDGESFKLYHAQDCCENVSVEDVCGDVQDLIGAPILEADESSSGENPEGVTVDYQESFTWTFYRLRTIKGGVTIRWYGESNGYYSESVDFCRIGGDHAD